MPASDRPHRPGVGAVTALTLTALLAAGCSGSPAPTDAPPPATAASSTAASATASSTPSGKPGGAETGTAGKHGDKHKASSSPATTAVAPPTPGDVQSTVPSRTVPTKAPVRITKPARLTDAKVKITKQQSITSKAQGPGEVSGAAVAMTVMITNTGRSKLDLTSVVINVADADGNPAAQMSGSPARPFSGRLGAGDDATGVYVYNIARSARGKITVEVSVTPELPTVVFVGKAI